VSYAEFLQRKLVAVKPAGFEPKPFTAPLFHYQRDVAAFVLQQGRSAQFLDTGLGKTAVGLEWAKQVSEHVNGPVLVLTPLAVAQQTKREGEKFGIETRVVRDQSEVRPGINICNYERLQRLDPSAFVGVILDESSILKSFMGKTKQRLIEAFANTPYRLCQTATPAPNDYMELGNHADFLGVMPSNEMLSRWFINDTMNFGNYRLKGHAIGPFWDWVASWARCASRPSDLGHSDDGFQLPELDIQQHVIDVDMTTDAEGELFRRVEMSATNLHREKRRTVGARAHRVADLVNASADAWIVWCDTDYEADALSAIIPGAVEVRGSDPMESKEDRLLAFTLGNERVIITKPSIAGFGLNWQHCHNMAFVGVSYSYESFYQAVRRCWRFGQAKPVNAHIVMAQTEGAIWSVVTAKADAHSGMKDEMRDAMLRAQGASSAIKTPYIATHKARLPEWLIAA